MGGLLSLRELEALASALLTVFLAFLGARISADETGFLEFAAQIAVKLYKSTSNAVTYCSCLTGNSAASHVDVDVELTQSISELQGLANDHALSFAAEIVFGRSLVDRDRTGTGTQEYTSYCSLAPSRTVVLKL